MDLRCVLILFLLITQVTSFPMKRNILEMVKHVQSVLDYVDKLEILPKHTWPNQLGWIQEPKLHENLTYKHLSAFHCYTRKAATLDMDEKMMNICQDIKDLKSWMCSKDCEEETCQLPTFDTDDHTKSLMFVRNLLMLLKQWLEKGVK